MSLLDPIQSTLNPALWDVGSNTLLPKVSNQILQRLGHLIDFGMVKSIILIGSNAGLQYNNTSDIDVQVTTTIPVGREGEDLLSHFHELFKAHNHDGNNFLDGTSHPINFFVMPDIELNYSDEVSSVYLIRDLQSGNSDIWIRPWLKKEELLDPNIRFGVSMSYANLLSSKIKNDVKLLEENIKRLDTVPKSKIINRIRELEEEITELADSFRELDGNRKLQYDFGWGVPKYSDNNMLYKIIERRGLLDLLEKMYRLSE